MNEMTCTKSKLICKIAILVLILLVVWFYLAFNRHMVWPGLCTGVNMKIEGGEVKAAQIDGQHLAVTANFPGQGVTKVILYDYCSGRVLSSVESTK